MGVLRDFEIRAALGTTLDAARGAVDSLDSEALRAVGIAARHAPPLLPERELPTRPTLKAVLKGRLPLTPAAKAAFQKAARPMRRGKHINPQDVLLALVAYEAPDPSAVLLDALRVDTREVRRVLSRSAVA